MTIPENTPIPYKVAKIRAKDVDWEKNGRVRYSIVSGASNLFNIDYSTGDVTLTENLSTKSSPIMELVIRAQDSGSPALSNTTILEISILDINDHVSLFDSHSKRWVLNRQTLFQAPKFYSEQLPISVRESVPTGYLAGRVQAFDADSGENAHIEYSLSFPDSAFPPPPFAIDPHTGWISTTGDVDREMAHKYEFDAVATDNGSTPLSSRIAVIVTIVDENDNAPTFERSIYNVSVAENARRGDEVVRVVAHDRDELSSVSYSLASEGNEQHQFAILSQNDHGLITVNGALDYGQRPMYTLTVKATDDGGISDTATILVYIIDVNSSPVFKDHPFTQILSESQPVNHTVTILQAEDKDKGRNAELTYQLDGDKGYFSIDNKTGVIRIRKPLDREAKADYNLVVTARDHGSPPLSAITHLEVLIDDVNDNRPTFEKQTYQLSIAEDTAPGTSIFTVTAVDRDAGDNRVIKYRFAEYSTGNDTFKIDATSGTIRIEQALDREQTAVYNLTVLAVDGGSPMLTGKASVIIDLTDVNGKFSTTLTNR